MVAAKTILLAATIAVLLSIGALVAGWFAFVSAPSPPEVCAHIIEVTIEEAGAQGMTSTTQSQLIERLQEQCIRHKEDKIHLRGRLVYAQHARCIMDADTLRAIEEC